LQHARLAAEAATRRQAVLVVFDTFTLVPMIFAAAAVWATAPSTSHWTWHEEHRAHWDSRWGSVSRSRRRRPPTHWWPSDSDLAGELYEIRLGFFDEETTRLEPIANPFEA